MTDKMQGQAPVNPLLHEFCFPLIFQLKSKMGSYRHVKFFHDPFLFQNRIFCQMWFLDEGLNGTKVGFDITEIPLNRSWIVRLNPH